MRAPRVEIKWVDIIGFGDWNEVPETFDAPVLSTLGYLVGFDLLGEELVLATTYDLASDTHADHSTFPMGCIKNIIYLKEERHEEVVGSYSVTRLRDVEHS